MTGQRRPIELEGFEEWHAHSLAEGWSDGLPLFPPLEDHVAAAIMHAGRAADEELGLIPPANGRATVREVAVQAVMAGCEPRLMPFVIAALEAMLDPSFDLLPVQATTNGSAPLVVVSGPRAAEFGFSGDYAAFAGSSRANVGLGRAVRLVLRNIGRAVPGDSSNVAHGHPGWLSYSITDRSDGPWGPLHERRGFDAGDTCVTVFFCQAPFAMYVPGSAERILSVLAETLPTPGVNMYYGGGQFLLSFAPKPARELARAGFTARMVTEWVWEHARYRLDDLRRSGIFGTEGHTLYWGARSNMPDLTQLPATSRLPMVDGPDDVHVVVNGSDGQWWAAFCPGWGEFGGYAVTKRVSLPPPAAR